MSSFSRWYYTSVIFCITTTGFANIMTANNILGEPLQPCSHSPLTGYYRDGYCNTADEDHGTHVVCAVVTQKFLDYTKSQGNDLTTVNMRYRFPGLKPGDKWCLCALRWKEAYDAGAAPGINPSSTHSKALEYIPLETLLAFRVDQNNAKK